MVEQATIDISDARRQLSSIDERLRSEPIIYVTRHGKRAFAIVDAECLWAMRETLEIMADPTSCEMFQSSLHDIQEGRMHDHDDLMEQLG